jgi:carboxymethylenebutenolidase
MLVECNGAKVWDATVPAALFSTFLEVPMPVQAEWVRYGQHSAFLARPEGVSSPLPAVLVIQEIWGVDGHIEDVTRRIAASGYAALAPDLYAVNGERPRPLVRERVAGVMAFMNTLAPAVFGDPEARAKAMAVLPQPERGRMEESYGALFGHIGKLEQFVPALRAAAAHLRRDCAASAGQKVGCVGFCMGGGLTALLACEEPELAAGAIFYGSAPPLERVTRIPCPMAGFYGSLDARVNAGLPAFAEAMRSAGKAFEYQVYDGAAHAFFNDTRPSYHVGAARDSFARLLEFFRRNLAP